MGSKNRIAKDILPIILKDRKEGQWYVEPFVGGANIIDKVDGNRIGSDSNEYLIAMWKELQKGWKPVKINKETYIHVKSNKDHHPKHFVGWVGFNCSYSGKWFGGFAGTITTKINTIRDYQDEAIRNIEAQVTLLQDVDFQNTSYQDLILPSNSIIYCDPPYKNTTGYKNTFNHDEFYDWCREKKNEGYTIFISEYQMPDDFKCVWQKEVKSSLSANGKVGGNKNSIEKLFTL